MSTCKKIKELMIDAQYDQLSPEEDERFRMHLRTCNACAEEYERMIALMRVMSGRRRPRMDETYWESYMDRLEDKLDMLDNAEGVTGVEKLKSGGPVAVPGVSPLEERFRRWRHKARWFLVPVAAAALLFVGIGIGQYLSLPEGLQMVQRTIASVKSLSPAVAAHFDNVQPVLLDYAASTPAPTRAGGSADEPEEMVAVPKSAVKKLLMENQLLKRVVAKEDDITVKRLMDELELILLELSNSDEDDAEITRKAVQRLIKDNDVLFRMKVIKEKEKEKENNKPLNV